ncbi:MAG TPA: hypothetical protein VEQ59_18195, partial [Polyangiaceae bacterium]|nr:hypothetical protein [Polyangiaceae bacterium]
MSWEGRFEPCRESGEQESCQALAYIVTPSANGPILDSCFTEGRGYGGDPMVEPGLVTLTKIVGTLLLAMGIIPFM